MDDLNPESLVILENAKLEPGLLENSNGIRYQFERTGYFFRDETHETTKPIFNRIVNLRDSWAKQEQQHD